MKHWEGSKGNVSFNCFSVSRLSNLASVVNQDSLSAFQEQFQRDHDIAYLPRFLEDSINQVNCYKLYCEQLLNQENKKQH